MINSTRGRKRSSSKNIFRTAVLAAPAVLAASALSQRAVAGTLYWDSNGASASNDVSGTDLGGTGQWDNASVNWWDGILVFGTPDPDQAYVSNSDAIFNGTAGTVTTGAAVTAGSLSFNTTGYIVNGASPNNIVMQVSGNPTGTPPAITVGSGLTATINAQLAGNRGILVNGGGTLVLGNSNNSATLAGDGTTTGGTSPGVTLAATTTLQISNAPVASSYDGYFGTSANTSGRLSLGGTLRIGAGGAGTLSVPIKITNTTDNIGIVDQPNTSATFVTFSGAIGGGPSSLTKTGPGMLFLTNAGNTFGSSGNTNNITVLAGQIWGTAASLGSDLATNSMTLNGATASFSPYIAPGAAMTLNRGLIIGTNGGGINPRHGSVEGGAGIQNGITTVTLAGAISGLSGGVSGVSKFTKLSSGTIILNNTSPRTGAFPSAGSNWTGDIDIHTGGQGGNFDVGGNGVSTGTTNGYLPGYDPTQFNGANPIPYYPIINLVETTATLRFLHSGAGTNNANQNAVRIIGAGSVQVLGPVTETIYGDCTYTGATTVASGATFAIGASGTLSPQGSLGNTAIANAGTMRFRNDAQATTFPGTVSGAGALQFQGLNTLTLTGNSAPTGSVTISGGATVAFGNNVSSSGSIARDITDNGILAFNRNDAALNYANVLSGTGTLVQTGSGTSTLSGAAANTYTGLTTVSAGTLVLAKTAGVNAVGGTAPGNGGVRINTGGKLQLNANNQITDTSAIDLFGGTLFANDKSEQMGVLTLDDNSVIDMGTGSSAILLFADSSAASWPGGKILTINNWSGTLDTGGGTEQLKFDSSNASLPAGGIEAIRFVNPVGLGAGTYNATWASGNAGEVVPQVPEPSSLALLGIGSAVMLRRRRK